MSPKEKGKPEINPTAQVISALVMAMQELAMTPKEQEAAANDVGSIQNVLFFLLMRYKNPDTATLIKALMQATRMIRMNEQEIADLATRKDLVELFSAFLSPFRKE